MQNKILENYELVPDVTDFENVCFKNTNFASKSLDSFEFIECTFISCDLSMAKTENTVFTRVKFENCKLLGVNFSECSKFAFSVYFKDSVLNYCHFEKNDFRKSRFEDCLIKEAGFFDSDLSLAQFDNCDLSDSVFEGCNLSKCDFTTSNNYSISPSENNIKKAKFSYPGVLGLLNSFNIIIED